jgi:transposase
MRTTPLSIDPLHGEQPRITILPCSAARRGSLKPPRLDQIKAAAEGWEVYVAATSLGGHLQVPPGGVRRRGCSARCLDCSRAPRRVGRKRGILSNALGRSRGGFSTKIHAVVDTHGRPLHIEITPGQQHESTVAQQLLEHAEGKAVIADTGYDSDAIRSAVRQRGMKAVICANPTRKRKPRLDRKAYAKRYLIEVFFHKLKRFRALAMRFEKTATSYLGALHLACAAIWLRELLGDA